MNTQQRIFKLEHTAKKTMKEPFLIEYIDDPEDTDDTKAMLSVFEGEHKGIYNLNAKELADYNADSLVGFEWAKYLPRPIRIIGYDTIYKRKPRFRTDTV